MLNMEYGDGGPLGPSQTVPRIYVNNALMCD